MDELKPCPFCGGEAILLENRQQWGNCLLKGWVVLCMTCSGGANNTNKEAVIAHWNKRREQA